MSKQTRTIGFLLRSTAALPLLAAAPRSQQADLTPEWISQLPVGSALSAGMQDMVVDASGVSYVTGITGPSYNTDIITAAFAADGSLLWSQVFNGPQDWHDQARGITLGPEGVVYVTGNTPGPGLYANVLLLEYDAATGALLDMVQYSSGPFTAEYGGSIATDQAGNVYIGGGTVGDGSDAMVLSFDASGAFRWKRTWDGPAFAPYSQDQARQIRCDPSGFPIVLIHGVMSSLHPDYVVVKMSPLDGSTVWETSWGLSGDDSPRDMEIDAAGDVYVTGTAFDFINRFGTIKLRGSDGGLLWQAYDGAGADDSGFALALDGVGGVYVTGAVDPDGDLSNFNDDFYTVKRDAGTGVQMWTHLYGANCVGCFDAPADVVVDPAGNVFVAGTTSSPPYSADTITFVLSSETGIETRRGVVSSGAGAAFLRFDAAHDLYVGGNAGNVDTGEVDMTLFRYASLVTPRYRLKVRNLSPGQVATFDVTGAEPSALQYVTYSLHGPGSTPLPMLGVMLDLSAAHLLTMGPADSSGTYTWSMPVPPGLPRFELWFQGAELGATTEVVGHPLGDELRQR